MTSFTLRRRKDDDDLDPGETTSDQAGAATVFTTSQSGTGTSTLSTAQSVQTNSSSTSSTTPLSHSPSPSAVGGSPATGLSGTASTTTLTSTTPSVQFTAPTPSPTLQISDPSHHSGQTAVAIVFETIGALIGLILLVCLLRFIYSYRKTPHYDRAAAAIQRHRLYREMTERDRSSVGSSGTHAVLPAYEPRPPSFVSNENPFEDPTGVDNVSDYGSPFRDPSPEPDPQRHLV